jgi:tRNA-2-methylthio-N6-dimethylallyladenosine synthase
MKPKTYHIITIGCQMNQADSERLAGVFERDGFKKISDKYKSDIVVINTCGVRQSAENRIYGLIPKIKSVHPGVKIILTGCLVNRKDIQRKMKKYVDQWLGITQISKQGNYLSLLPSYESKVSALVPIGNGCDNFCSYCVVPYARGREVYRPAKEILAEVKKLVKSGYKEIILLAQNVNSYKSGRIDFADLLKSINKIKGDFWIRFLTSHPKDMSDKLIRVIAGSEKVCHQIHLPAQAGDDVILKKMNRKYTRSDYLKLVGKIRRAMPNASFTTDIIVGYPDETKKQFENTARLMKKVKFDMAYISEYSPRPGTAAFKLKDNVPRAEKQSRKNTLDKILHGTALFNNKKYIGKTVKVLVENKTRAGEWFGKTATGKDIRFFTGRAICKAGNFVNVKVTKANTFSLSGIIYDSK